MGSGSYSAETRSIQVSVEPVFLDEQSSPAESRFVWAYHIRIDNNGRETVQLRRRYWRITDELGRVQEVRGQGVVGVEPVIGPGQSFEYTSGAPVTTPSAFMVGSYEMETETGDRFEVAIPAFSLDSPHRPIRLN
jgi:ApaG protein